MIVSIFEKNGRKSEIHHENNQFFVRLYENNILIDEQSLAGHSIHYAESLAENFVDRIGSFNTTKQFLRD
jgi:hypothetical protein